MKQKLEIQKYSTKFALFMNVGLTIALCVALVFFSIYLKGGVSDLKTLIDSALNLVFNNFYIVVILLTVIVIILTIRKNVDLLKFKTKEQKEKK